MGCPFPGMDPYLERPALWADFHDSLIPAIRAWLQPLLRPKYAALVQDFELSREEIRQPYIKIVEPAAGNRLVTAIEVLSPDNKKPGPGRKKYLKKCQEFWDGGANLLEIDLLREGKATFRIPSEGLASLEPWRYMAIVRRWPDRQEVYPIPLEKRLPKIALPLNAGDTDVTLDLQAVFTRCWEEGPYPELLRYEGPPPGAMSPEEIGWCDQQLRQGGFRRGEGTGTVINGK